MASLIIVVTVGIFLPFLLLGALALCKAQHDADECMECIKQDEMRSEYQKIPKEVQSSERT